MSLLLCPTAPMYACVYLHMQKSFHMPPSPPLPAFNSNAVLLHPPHTPPHTSSPTMNRRPSPMPPAASPPPLPFGRLLLLVLALLLLILPVMVVLGLYGFVSRACQWSSQARVVVMRTMHEARRCFPLAISCGGGGLVATKINSCGKSLIIPLGYFTSQTANALEARLTLSNMSTAGYTLTSSPPVQAPRFFLWPTVLDGRKQAFTTILVHDTKFFVLLSFISSFSFPLYIFCSDLHYNSSKGFLNFLFLPPSLPPCLLPPTIFNSCTYKI